MRSSLQGTIFLPHRDLNHGSMNPTASVLPMSYADPTKSSRVFFNFRFERESPFKANLHFQLKILHLVNMYFLFYLFFTCGRKVLIENIWGLLNTLTEIP